jgi:hypothetical protein
MSIDRVSPQRQLPPPPAEFTPIRGSAKAAALPEMPLPRVVGPGLVTGAMTKLGMVSSELTLLALESDNTRVGLATSRDVIRALGRFIAVEHAATQEQFRKSMAAAKHKAWWQKFLIAFRVISIAASLATGGVTGAIAAGLMVAAWAVEKSHPKVALGLQLAAVALLLSDAAANIIASSSNVATGASAGFRAGCKYVAAGAQVGSGIGTAMVGHYSASELRADAARLLLKQQVEQTQQNQRDGLAFMKALYQHGQEVERDCNQITELRNDGAAASIRA